MPSKLALFVLTAFISLGIGFFLGTAAPQKETETDIYTSEKHTKIPGSLISPLIECEQPKAYTLGHYKRLEEKIKSLTASFIDSGSASEISVYFRDLNNGPWIGIGEDQDFSPASLLKLPLLMTYYKASEANPNLLNETVTIKPEDVMSAHPELQFITPKAPLSHNKTYTVSQIIENLIIYSDNGAWYTLVSYIPEETLATIYEDLAVPFPSVDKPADFISVRQYSSFFRVLYNASYLSEEMSEKALRLLARTDFNGGLKKGVPENVTVAHKFGERLVTADIRQFHDCGIIYHPKRPYILCVMTRGKDFPKLTEMISEISRIVYQEF